MSRPPRAFDEELVSGSILRSVWKLSWPLVLGNLVRGAHGFIDHILVGRYVDAPANAANAGVGLAWTAFLVILVFVASLYHGMSVYVARYTGRQDRLTVSQVAYQTFLFSLFILVPMAPIGYFAAPYILRFIEATPTEMQHALPYLRILFTMGMPLFLMFLLGGAMQASGDPRTPLVLSVFATCINIVLSYVLITGWGPFPMLGAAGAGLATVAASLLSFLLGVAYIWSGRAIIQPPERLNLIPDWTIVGPIVRMGLPAGLNAVVLNAVGFFLLKAMGYLDGQTGAKAAYVICYSQLFSLVLWASWALRNAASALMGQNIGAGDTPRGQRSVYVTAAAGLAWGALGACLYLAIPGPLMALFGANDPAVMAVAVPGLRYLAISALLTPPMLVFTGALVGAGDTRTPLYVALITQLGLTLGLIYTLLWTGNLTMNWIWAAIVLGHATRFALTYAAYQHGAWRKIKVDFGEGEAHGS